MVAFIHMHHGSFADMQARNQFQDVLYIAFARDRREPPSFVWNVQLAGQDIEGLLKLTFAKASTNSLHGEFSLAVEQNE